MKIYSEVRWDIETGDISYEDSFEYEGSISECKGGGATTTNTQDTEYNARLASIQESQQQMAETAFYDIWTGSPGSVQQTASSVLSTPGGTFRGIFPSIPNVAQPSTVETTPRASAFDGDDLSTYGYRDLTLDQMKAQGLLMPQETQLSKAQIEADIMNLPSLAGLEKDVAEDARTLLRERAPARTKFFEESVKGVDPTEEMDKAQASVEHGFGVGERSLRSKAFEYGGVTSNQAANIRKAMLLNKAKGIAGARTTARDKASDTNYARLEKAASQGV